MSGGLVPVSVSRRVELLISDPADGDRGELEAEEDRAELSDDE